MTADTDILDALVVGAGWAGLGVSYYLGRAGLRHRVLERGRIAETWRTQRWDSFRVNLPNFATVMPGCRYDGPEPEGFMTRDEFVDLLEGFAAHNRLPVETAAPVVDLTYDEGTASLYRVTTPHGNLLARNVVIASGDLNRPRRHRLAESLPSGLLQVHAGEYRHAGALAPGAVLVVGCGQSGGQVAEDLIASGRTVYLATGRTGRIPRRYRGHDIVFWMQASGVFDVPRRDLIDEAGKLPARPLVGAGWTISLQSLSAQGAVLLGRLEGSEAGCVIFADDVAENLRIGDDASTKVKRHVDDYIARQGLDAPAAVPDPAETVVARLPDPPTRSLNPVERGISTVLWCNGFDGDFGWVRLPVCDSRGRPMHEDGVTDCPGIYFAGLDFLSTRKSGTLLAVAEEGQRLVEHILARR